MSYDCRSRAYFILECVNSRDGPFCRWPIFVGLQYYVGSVDGAQHTGGRMASILPFTCSRFNTVARPQTSSRRTQLTVTWQYSQTMYFDYYSQFWATFFFTRKGYACPPISKIRFKTRAHRYQFRIYSPFIHKMSSNIKQHTRITQERPTLNIEPEEGSTRKAKHNINVKHTKRNHWINNKEMCILKKNIWWQTFPTIFGIGVMCGKCAPDAVHIYSVYSFICFLLAAAAAAAWASSIYRQPHTRTHNTNMHR